MTDPVVPWWQYAAKALAAFAVGVIAASGVIIASVEDGHVTMTEWVTIGLAVVGALAAPGVVYAVPNKAKP